MREQSPEPYLQGLGHAFKVYVVKRGGGAVQIKLLVVHDTKLVVVEFPRFSDRV